MAYNDSSDIVAPASKRSKRSSTSSSEPIVIEDDTIDADALPSFPLYETAFLTTHKDSVICIAYSSDGETVASGSEDASIKLVDTSKIIASYDDRPTQAMIKARQQAELSQLNGPKEINHEMTQQEQNGAIDLISMRPIVKAYHDHTAHVNDLSFHPLYNILASASSDCSLRLFEYKQHHIRRAVKVIPESSPVRSLAYHPCGQYLLVGCEQPIIRIYDTETFQCYRQLNINRQKDQHTDSIQCARYSTTGNMYVTASSDGSVKLWDGIRNIQIQSLDAIHSSTPVISCAFNHDSTQLLTTGLDSTSQIWDIRHLTSEPLFALQFAHNLTGAQHSRKPMKACFDAQQKHVISADERTNEVIIFDVAQGEIISKIGQNHQKCIRVAAAVSLPACENRQFFATGGEDSKARFWVEKIKQPTT